MAASNKTVKESLKAIAQRDRDGVLPILGLEQDVRSLRAQKKSIELLEQDHKQKLESFREVVGERRKAAQDQGLLVRTCSVWAGPEQDPVTVTWKDAYSNMELRDEPVLRQAFGDRYPMFFSRQASMKIREGVSLDTMKATLGEDAWDKLQQFVDISEHIRLRGKVMEARADLKATASKADKELIERVDIIIESKQHAAQVRL